MDMNTLIEIKNLKKYFTIKKGLFQKEPIILKAVDNISFSIKRGETLGLVGESGCGKTTCGRTILKLYEPTAGEIIYKGENITSLKPSKMLSYRKEMQMIFQDPYASLDPRMMVGDIIAEGINSHVSNREKRDMVQILLKRVGLNSEHSNRYPHEFSGGQRQRIGIARALALKPEFIVCDEPISALDVSIQAQIVNMLEDLQGEFGLTYLFIAHDISMVKHISSRIGVMYLGKLVEIGDSNEIYTNPIHPYTQALLSAIPIPDPRESAKKKRIILQGDVPSPINVPSGCRFRGRCRYAMPICSEQEPLMKEVGSNHNVACFLLK